MSGAAANTPTRIISLPQGGGAIKGLGEKFSPDLQTGTGNLSVPIEVPPGRQGFQPTLHLGYSTANGNSCFGVGWALTVPGVQRRTTPVPRYDDLRDTFVLSGAEDLVPLSAPAPGVTLYRPRVEGLFARIEHHITAGSDYWQVTAKDGLVSRYGTARPATAPDDWRDPAALTNAGRVFAWHLTSTHDPLGNVIRYEYGQDEGEGAGHRWSRPLLRTIRYADHDAESGGEQFLASVDFAYEQRPDPFSDHRAGFEVRTTVRCRTVTTAVRPGAERLVRRYSLGYEEAPYNGISLLTSVRVEGFDDTNVARPSLPPLDFSYTCFDPTRRSLIPLSGDDLPVVSLRDSDHEFADVVGDGLPDLVELGDTARYWRNLGAGRFDCARSMSSGPAGLRLSDTGVQLLDADGDGVVDLLVAAPEGAGCFPLRPGGNWGPYRPFRRAPSFELADPQVRLVDLTGDGVTDVLRAGSRLECFFQDPELGWTGPVSSRCAFPDVTFADSRFQLADMTGDGLRDLVLLGSGDITYCPGLGHGRWGSPVRMAASPRRPDGFDPARLLLGDVDGDGAADLVYVGDDEVTVWINRSGNGWSAPFTVTGTPEPGPAESLRVIDLAGTGTCGVLWSREPTGHGRPAMHFLDLTGGVTPRLLATVDNNIGARTEVTYTPSTNLGPPRAPEVGRWPTSLPIVVPVVTSVAVTDAITGGRLTTEYRYAHPHWDGPEKEFRGFARVDTLDTETTPHDADGTALAPPVLTRTWFHIGPVGDDDWTEPDWRGEYWAGDPDLLRHTEGVDDWLRRLRDPTGAPDRRARRDALRALRGSVLRTEVYARDGSAREHRPYTVTEYAYRLREEQASGPRRVFAPLLVAQRTTRWERGDDPMTEFILTGGHDAWGQPRTRTTVAPPRRSACRTRVTASPNRSFVPDTTTVIAMHTDTVHAEHPGEGPIHNRVAHVRTYELRDPPTVVEHAPHDVVAVLADQAAAAQAVRAVFAALDPARVRLTGHSLHHYDGAAYHGLPAGELGAHGLLTRSESLVFTDDVLDTAFGAGWRDRLGGESVHGYRRMKADGRYEDGWYADTLCRAHDVQLSTPDAPLPKRGLVLGIRDALGHETRITPDPYWLLPALVRDPVGLATTAQYDYRVGSPSRITDPNGTTTHYRHHSLGLLELSYLQGRGGEGGSEERPDVRYIHDFTTFAATGRPVNVRTLRRVWHAHDRLPADVTAGRDHDEVIETRAFSDGFGRLVQLRGQADESAFGADGDDCGVSARPGEAGPAVGTSVPGRVVVSGWQIHDNKGRVIRTYEPFHDVGWDYRPDARHGTGLTMTYDPLGRPIRVLGPDGAQRRAVPGIPDDLTDPDSAPPSPWTTTAYDENDLASVSTGQDGTPLSGRAPAAHHWTPVTTVVDALGRMLCRWVRGGTIPQRDGQAIRHTYDVRGNVLALDDELGRTAYTYVYDLHDRPLSAVGIDAGARWSLPDAVGNPVHSEDARGALTLRTYDALNRLTAVHARDMASAPLTLRERLTYGDQCADLEGALAAGLLGRLWHHHDEAGLVTAERYDLAGAVTEQVRRVVGDAAIAAAEPDGWTTDWSAPDAEAALDPAEYRTSTRHDARGRVVAVIAPQDVTGHRARILAGYGRSGALRSVSVDGTAYIRLLAHNARGQRVLMADGAGLVTRYAYDPDTHRLTRLRTERMERGTDETWTATGPALQDLTYRHDLTGTITQIEERTTGCGVAATPQGRDRLVRDFSHDAFGRLTSATGRACAAIAAPRPLDDHPLCGSYPKAPNQSNAPEITVGYRESYTYNEAGSLLDLVHETTTGTVRSAGWHRTFRVDVVTNRVDGVVNGDGPPIMMVYDACGNLTGQADTRRYTWDHAGRLVGVRTAAGAGTSVAARYLYGADGARVKKWVRRGGSASTDECTVYAGELTEHHRWSGHGGGAHTLLHVRGGGHRVATVRTGPPHPDEVAPAVRYELHDHLGSTALTVDATGRWTNRTEYFPYGEPSFGGFARQRYGHMGRERDTETGFTHCAARLYAAQLGRFVSCDPLGPAAGGDPYAFARGNPVSRADPTGLLDQDAAVPQAPPPELGATDAGHYRAESEGGGVTWHPGSPEAPDAGSTVAERIAPRARTDTEQWEYKGATDSLADEWVKVGLTWTALESSVAMGSEESSTYNDEAELGAWTKSRTGVVSGALFSAGQSISGPQLSVVKIGLTGHSGEAGLIWGTWMRGAVGQFNYDLLKADANIGVKDATMTAKFGVSAASARVSAGFNLAGLHLGVFVEGRVGAEFGVSGGAETAVHASVVSFGVTTGAAKGNDPNAGWVNFLWEVWERGISPSLPTKSPYERGTSVWRALER
ncbi:FG-GAP-like repeat-containing protein (plasmid) [Streptomyces chartreusis]|uniref:SpvB/TcaC N-terminal domain-containing protein n=1 Tax=Streptomyces chartreusis TaxID=1969 RepID=UPI002F90D540|nr:FG-GAP-like repeat-containing protein [Streptomyces chartreusis]